MKLQTRDAGTPCDDHGDPSGDETSMQQVWDIGADETLHEKLGFNGGRNIKKKKKRKESSETGKWEQNVFVRKPAGIGENGKMSCCWLLPSKVPLEICIFRKAEVPCYNRERSCQEVLALIALCPFCSTRSDNKSYKVTVARPQGCL